jgi:hypothetical protein
MFQKMQILCIFLSKIKEAFGSYWQKLKFSKKQAVLLVIQMGKNNILQM